MNKTLGSFGIELKPKIGDCGTDLIFKSLMFLLFEF